VDYLDTPPYTAAVIRRTAPDRSEIHEGVTEVQHVIEGSGSVITGGSLLEAVKTESGELRGQGITGGSERSVAAGDLIVIPAVWSGEVAATILLGIAIIGPKRRRALGAPAFCVLALLAGMVACGGGGSGSGGGGGGGGGGTGGTPAGTYTVTVTGTAGSTTHTTMFTLIVQ